MQGDDSTVPTRTARFAQFLRAAVAVKTKTVVEVEKYPTVLWFSSLPPETPQVRSPLLSSTWDADDIRWLVVSRVTEPELPAVPEPCVPWLQDVDLKTPEVPPALNAGRPERNAAGEEMLVEPSEEVRERWAAYVADKWTPWAQRAALARRVRPLYQKLFAAHQAMLGHDDAYDFLIGVGLLHARTDPTQPLRRHLLAFPAELSFDSKTGTLTVTPAADFAQARVEVDFLPPAKRAIVKRNADQLDSAIGEVGPTLQDRRSLGEIISSLVHSLDPESSYSDDLGPQDAGPGQMRASFAPALIMRPRSTRSIDELLAQIERAASGDDPSVALEETPVPWRRLIEDTEVWNGTEHESRPAAGGQANERVYFPLPSNEEQSRIVKFASGAAGVVVQGPPGTGKSHTIANLISHYLAVGKRVLVTAQTAQALQVLREKLPKELQTLCVSLLGATSASDKELQRSVKGILARRQEVDDPRSYAREAARLEAELVESERRLVALERSLRDARAAETEVLEPVSGYRGTRAAIARRLNEERATLGWIADEIAREVACPAYSLGWERLAQYHASLTAAVKLALGKAWVELPFDPSAAVQVVERIAGLKANVSDDEGQSATSIPPSVGTDPLGELLRWLESLETLELSTSSDDAPWFSELRAGLLRNDLSAWQALRREAAETLEVLSDTVVADTRKVEVGGGRSRAEARRDLTRLSEHYRAGGKRRILWLFKPGTVRATEWVEQAVQVEGAAIRSAAEVERARRALDGWASLEAAWAIWAHWPVTRGGSPRQQVAILRKRLEIVDAILGLGRSRESLAGPLQRWLSESSPRASTRDLATACRRRLEELALAGARGERDRLVASLDLAIGKSDVVPAVLQIRGGLLNEDLGGVHAGLADLGEDRTRRELHAEYVTFLEAVARSAPKLAMEVAAGEGSDGWRQRFNDFPLAWGHRCTVTWLATVLSQERIEATDRAAREERNRAQDLLRDIAAARAWHAALERIDDRMRAALVGWTQAVAHIPATGKSVFRRRAVARSYLGKCLEAIPAWVVSLGRLYETVDARPGMFDIAVVDEASQCWLDSLVLFYLAKQIIVVGDDKQISPTVVGVADGEIEALARAYISDFEYRGSFTIESSLFDHAQRYLSAGVPLQEHFRCVPEIIRFSNELCYTDRPLIPLRPCGRDRLEPLKATYLPDGLRHGDVNDAEASAIVEAIASCHADEAYEEADFGVICLQGDDQAARIQQLLLERLGPVVFEKRNLRCGNPYAFQGDERDVMFLSMVAAPNANNAPLTTKIFEQRFNVALSRARDQMWLFHSVRDQDLSPRCLRRRVLEFFYQPPDLAIRGSALNVPQLQLVAARAHRQSERPPAPFESWFEVDVALALAARGHTLSAQVQVAKRRIDLVIEGDGTRLAVECDGEAWHGPERFAEDLFRQRQLERAGWRFARVRESLFYCDPERAIAEVVAAWEELDVEAGTVTVEAARAYVSPGDGLGSARREMWQTEPGMPAIPMGAGRRGPLSVADESEDSGDDDKGKPLALPFLTDKGLSASSEVTADEERDGPFTGYGGKNYPDPRTAPPTNIRDAVLDIVTTDGPLPKASIYRLYRDGCPRIERAGKNLRQAVNRAVAALERAGLVETRDEGGHRDPADVVVKLRAQPWLDSRAPGRRALDDVPLSELAAAMRTINGPSRPVSDEAKLALYRAVARQFDVQRLRPQWFPRLERASQIAFADSA
ncbi:MAG TPA: AAA domain-containing protein [Vicinamibacterales bacterium]|nr:AAA domain-containing protein [Vicinamibacterales bacterium]